MRIPRNQRSWAEPGLAGQREPTPPLARHEEETCLQQDKQRLTRFLFPSEEGMGAVPLLGGVAEGRGGFRFASHVAKGGSTKAQGDFQSRLVLLEESNTN